MAPLPVGDPVESSGRSVERQPDLPAVREAEIADLVAGGPVGGDPDHSQELGVGDVRGEAQLVLGHDKRGSTSDPYFDLDEIDLAVGMGEADVVAGIVMRHLNHTVIEGRLGGQDGVDGAVPRLALRHGRVSRWAYCWPGLAGQLRRRGDPSGRSPWWDGHARRRAR